VRRGRIRTKTPKQIDARTVRPLTMKAGKDKPDTVVVKDVQAG
jgi:hypothetical protein